MADSSVAHLIGVLTAPGRTFRSIRDRPTWGVALLVLILIGAGVYALLSQRLDMADMVRQGIEARGTEMPEEQVERMIDLYESYGVLFSLVMILLGSPALYLIASLFLWVAVRLVGGELSFKQGFSVFVHSQMPQVVAGVLSLPAIFSRTDFGFEELKTGSILPSNLGFLAPSEAGAGLVSLLSSVDLFGFWTLVLLCIGFAAVSRLKIGTASAAVVTCWLIYALGKAGWAVVFG